MLERITETHRRGLGGAEIQRWLRTEHGIAVSRLSMFAALQQMRPHKVNQASLDELMPTLSAADALADDAAAEAPPLDGSSER